MTSRLHTSQAQEIAFTKSRVVNLPVCNNNKQLKAR